MMQPFIPQQVAQQQDIGKLMQQLNPTMYGVWIRGKGWLKVHSNAQGLMDCYADFNKEIAQDTADRFHGEVRFVDTSLFILEEQIITQEKEDDLRKAEAAAAILRYDAERRTLWRTFKTWLHSLSRR